MSKYKLGDKYRSNFDYDGMVDQGLKSSVSWGYDKLYKLHSSFEDVNYHTESKPLWNALTALKSGNVVEAEKQLAEFHKILKEDGTESYKKGANIKGVKKYYLAWTSWFDSNKYDVKKITEALNKIGATDVHLEHENGKSNQPEVVVFSYKGVDEPLKIIGEALDTEWIYIYPVNWVTQKNGKTYRVSNPENYITPEKDQLYIVDVNGITIVRANGKFKGGRFEGTSVYDTTGLNPVGHFDFKWDRETFKPYTGNMKFEHGGNTPRPFNYSIGGL